VVVPTINGAPVIDGRLDDAAWKPAAVVDDLEVYLPVPYAAPTATTRFLVMHDNDALYIGADMRDREPELIVQRQLIQRQIVFRDDNFEVALDPYDTRRGGYIFSTNPNGVQRDGLVFTGGRANMDWDGIWEARTRITEDGWTAEVVIPFKTIAFDPQRDEWGLNFTRMVRRKGEGLTWSMRDGQPTVDTMGVMAGMRGVAPGRGLDVVPSAILSERKDFMGGQSDTELKPSLDLFYRITPSLTAALTLNTDFSATEVDDRQVNLTRFSLFFPEKRDFFLEDAGIFEFAELTQNGRPFFSRTIGLSPSGEPVVSPPWAGSLPMEILRLSSLTVWSVLTLTFATPVGYRSGPSRARCGISSRTRRASAATMLPSGRAFAIPMIVWTCALGLQRSRKTSIPLWASSIAAVSVSTMEGPATAGATRTVGLVPIG
jgi:hypothetical protein